MDGAVHHETYRWLSHEMRRHGLQSLKDLQHYSGIHANAILDLLLQNDLHRSDTKEQLQALFHQPA